MLLLACTGECCLLLFYNKQTDREAAAKICGILAVSKPTCALALRSEANERTGNRPNG